MAAVLCTSFVIHSATPVQALDAKAGAVTSVSNSSNPQQTLEKKWTISSSGNAMNVKDIVLNIPGRVFISVSSTPLDALAEVRVSGNSKELLETFRVGGTTAVRDLDDDDSSEINELRVMMQTAENMKVKGHVLTEITLSKKALLESLFTRGTADVMIEENVLLSGTGTVQDGVDIVSMGTGSVYVSSLSTELATKSLKASAKGAGSIMLALSKVTLAKDLELGVEGTGIVTVTAKGLSARETDVDMSGSGNLCVAASNFSTSSFNVDAVGTGNALFTKAGTCKTGEVKTMGAGNVNAGSVVCEMMNVQKTGSGKVVVQASGTLSVRGEGVEYAGTAPKTIKPANGATVTTNKTPGECDSVQFPTRVPVEVSVQGGMISQGSGPMADQPSGGSGNSASKSDKKKDSAGKKTNTPSSTQSGAISTKLLGSIVPVVFAAVSFAMYM